MESVGLGRPGQGSVDGRLCRAQLRFPRRHADGTKVYPEIFWFLPFNARTFKAGRIRDQISSGRFPEEEYFLLADVNDIEAVRLPQPEEQRQRLQRLSTIVIGGRKRRAGVAVGLVSVQQTPPDSQPFAAASLCRNMGKTDRSDIAACVWLSMGLERDPASRWLTGPSQLSGPVPIPGSADGIFYGDKDVNRRRPPRFYSFHQVGRSNPETIKLKPIRNSKAVEAVLKE